MSVPTKFIKQKVLEVRANSKVDLSLSKLVSPVHTGEVENVAHSFCRGVAVAYQNCLRRLILHKIKTPQLGGRQSH